MKSLLISTNQVSHLPLYLSIIEQKTKNSLNNFAKFAPFLPENKYYYQKELVFSSIFYENPVYEGKNQLILHLIKILISNNLTVILLLSPCY